MRKVQSSDKISTKVPVFDSVLCYNLIKMRKDKITNSKTISLQKDAEGVYLTDGVLTMRGDFSHMLPRLRPERIGSEFLVKAAKKKPSETRLIAVDATAGMGEDALILAAAGYEVYLYEKDDTIATLLEDTLLKSASDPELNKYVSHMHFTHADSIKRMANLSFEPDIILLDPMFPGRKKSGAIKKKFQLLQQLEKPCEDEEALFLAAVNAHPAKIIVKRPSKGPNLAGQKPQYSINGPTIRYDVYVFTKI